MKTNLITAVSVVLLLLMAIFGISQMNQNRKHQQVLASKEQAIKELSKTIHKEKEKVDILSEQNEIYIDSIIILNERIAILETALNKKNEQIKYLKGKLNRREIEYQDLKDKIARLYKKEKLDQSAIAKLEMEKKELRKEMTNIKVNTKEVFAARNVAEKEITNYRKHVNKMSLVTSIAENTRVDFKNVEAKKFRNGRKINKMRRNMNGWQYTDFKFILSHSNHQSLLDKTFVLKIYDKEHKIPLAYIEQNPKFADHHQKGLPFKFDGNEIELTYCNMQKKQAENFEARIFVINNGEEIPLKNGTITIVENGKFVSI